MTGEIQDLCEMCLGEGCEQCEFTGRKRIPTAQTHNITLRSGRQVALEDLPDKLLARMARKSLRNLRREIFEVLMMQKEMETRDYEGKEVSKLTMFRDYNIFQLTRHASIIAANKYNMTYDNKVEIFNDDGDEEQ
tara:strand:- start:3091 stop:3495 length:405 start_codon:yes stop_codon:yes gene_type:complete